MSFQDCSGPGLPWSALYQSAEPKFLRVIESDLEKQLAQYDLPQIQNLDVPVPGTGNIFGNIINLNLDFKMIFIVFRSKG